jgi:hypothetical protein
MSEYNNYSVIVSLLNRCIIHTATKLLTRQIFFRIGCFDRLMNSAKMIFKNLFAELKM